MNNRKSKQLTKLAQQLNQTGKVYLTKTSTKFTQDLQGNNLPYTVDQTRLHPKSEKYVLKMLKKLNRSMDVFKVDFDKLQALIHSEGEAIVSELMEQGYRVV